MDFIYTMRSYFNSILPISFWDIIDILILTVIIYKMITLVKETRAGGLLKGIALLFIAYAVMDFSR